MKRDTPGIALPDFLDGVWQGMMDLVHATVPGKEQRQLLLATLDRYRGQVSGNPFSDPLSWFHLVVSAESGQHDERARWLGAFCQFYILSLDLIDDVQDNDLGGKPHEAAGPAVAINSGLALFALALAAQGRAMAQEVDPSRWAAHHTLLATTFMAACAGQHEDLTRSARTVDDVLVAHRGKTSSIVLVIECAALHAAASQAAMARYRQAAEHLAVLVQIVDDMRDIFGKPASPDLDGGKVTYPVAAFLEEATPEQEASFAELVKQGAAGLRGVRKLFYDTGAVRRTAEAMESSRRAIHAAITGLDNSHPALRTWLCLADSLAGTIYVPPPLPESGALLQPDRPWDNMVRGLAAQFADDLRWFGPPATPQMVPWPLSQFMYDPARRTLFYADIEGQPAEILPAMAALLGSQDLAWARSVAEGQAPLVIAHELFHHWRDAAGRLTSDFWFEELAASRLAIAYIRHFRPDVVDATRQVAARALAAHPDGLSPTCQAILDRLVRPDRQPEAGDPGYGVNIRDVALIQFAMVLHILDEDVSHRALIGELLSRGSTHCGERC